MPSPIPQTTAEFAQYLTAQTPVFDQQILDEISVEEYIPPVTPFHIDVNTGHLVFGVDHAYEQKPVAVPQADGIYGCDTP